MAAHGKDIPIDMMEVGEPLMPLVSEGNYTAKIDRMLTFDPSKIDISTWINSWSRIIATN